MGILRLTYLYLFLPLSLLLFLLCPRRLRAPLLLALSLLFYLAVEPDGFGLLFFSVASDYLMLQLVRKQFGGVRLLPAWPVLSAVKSLAVILYAALSAWTEGTLLLGVLFYTLSGTDCVLGATRGQLKCASGPVQFALLCVFFPRITAGPYPDHDAFVSQLDGAPPSFAQILEGGTILLIGAAKVLFLGAHMLALYTILAGYGEVTSMLSAWCTLLTLALYVYYHYSGLWDMARGSALLFGLELPWNYYYPYQSLGVLDFLQRFNTSFWQLLYRLFGFREAKAQRPPRDLWALPLMGMLMGLWFGFRLHLLLWGCFLSLFALLERYPLRELTGVPLLFRRVYSFLVVLTSFLLFAGPDLEMNRFFAHLMGKGVEFYNYQIIALLATNWIVLLLGCLLATSLCGVIVRAVRQALPVPLGVFTLIVDFGLLALVSALLLS